MDDIMMRYSYVNYIGSHIKGLLVNFIHHFWPALLQQDNFVEEFITPIVKASKGKKKMVFFTIPEYEQWKNSIPKDEISSWHIKYYKGKCIKIIN
jgi:DNA topoisomerase-2